MANYKDIWIYKFHESDIRKILTESNQPMTLYLSSDTEKKNPIQYSGDIRTLYNSFNGSDIDLCNAIEHYILREFKSPHSEKIHKGMIEWINTTGNIFLQNPAFETKCSLFRDENVEDLLYGHNLEKIKEAKKTFTKRASQLYQESLKRELNNSEKTELMGFFNINIRTKNENIKKAQRDYAKKILLKNEIPSNLEEFKFILNYAQIHVLEQSKTLEAFSDLFVANLNSPFLGGYQSNEQIFINKDADRSYWENLSDFIQIVCHETQHAVQEVKANKNPDSITALEYTEYHLFRRHLSSNNYDPYNYEKNYRYQEIEKDAEQMGHYYASSLYYSYNISELNKIGAGINSRRRQAEIDRTYQYEYVTDLDGTKTTKENFNVKHLNEIISKRPSYLEHYPVLQRLYNKDGTPKSFESMITEQIKANETDVYKIYDDHLIYAIRYQDGLEKLDLSRYSSDEQANILKRLVELNYNEVDVLKKFINPQTNEKFDYTEERENQIIESLGSYHMYLAQKLSSFLVENYSTIYELSESGAMGPVFNSDRFENDLEALSNQINNYKEDTPFKKVAEENAISLKSKMGQVNQMKNIFYVREKLKDLEPEELEKKVSLPNGSQISLRQYAEEYITSRMSHHSFISEDGKAISISDAIKNAAQKQETTMNNATYQQLDNLSIKQLDELATTGKVATDEYNGVENKTTKK